MIYKGKNRTVDLNSIESVICLFKEFKWLNEYFISCTENIINKINNIIIDEKNTKIVKKSLKKTFAKIFYSSTILNVQYWIDRGWDKDKAMNKINEIQKERSQSSKKKFEFLKENDNNIWRTLSNTRIEYYLNKGLSLDDAKTALYNRQKTFSKNKCIQKFGEEKGLMLWEERQKKWLHTMEEKSIEQKKIMNTSKDSNSVNFFQKKYNNDWQYHMLDQNDYSNDHKIQINEFFNNCNNVNELASFIVENFEFETQLKLEWIFKSKLIQDYFNVSYDAIKSTVLKDFDEKNDLRIKKTIFGHIRYFDSHICRSTGEYQISKFLKENKIDYKYEGFYPLQTEKPPKGYKYDFYLHNLDLYIEYLGLYKKSNKEYIKRIKEKENFCKQNEINFLFSKNYDNIIKEIELKTKNI